MVPSRKPSAAPAPARNASSLERLPNHFSAAIADTGGGVALRDATGAIVDSVGYGDAVNVFVEAHAASAPPASAAPGSSIVRIPDGHDTNDNVADFSVSTSPTPGGTNH